VTAGRFAAGELEPAAELRGSVLDEPFGGVVAVVCAGGPGVFLRLPLVPVLLDRVSVEARKTYWG
jgi:hypothetical protein